MTRIFSSALAAMAIAGLVSVSAQTTPQQQPTERERAPKAKTVTVVGCLDQADPNREGARDSMSSTPFVLKNAEGGSAQTYALMPAPGAELAAHVNHKVQVTGTVAPTSSKQPSSAPGSTSGGSGTTASPTSERSSMGGGEKPVLTVQSVKMIAASCTP